jgi:hypothetical protein
VENNQTEREGEGRGGERERENATTGDDDDGNEKAKLFGRYFIFSFNLHWVSSSPPNQDGYDNFSF